MKNIAIFASGNGTNAEAIINHFDGSEIARVALIIANKKDAYVLKRAANHNIPSRIVNRNEFYDGHSLNEVLREYSIDLVVLAGFLWLIPSSLIDAYPGRIINIHPALLPSYGGKGMYGDRVHEAVKAAGDSETGITIHWVDENYDEGDIVFQARCSIESSDTPGDIASKVHKLEYQYYPPIIESILKNQ